LVRYCKSIFDRHWQCARNNIAQIPSVFIVHQEAEMTYKS